MRVDAAEFVPAGNTGEESSSSCAEKSAADGGSRLSASAQEFVLPADSCAEKSAADSGSGLSASAQEFVLPADGCAEKSAADSGSGLSASAQEFVLSADTPEFVPGASVADHQTWHGTENDYWSQGGYGSSGTTQYTTDIVEYIDEETFLTPQILSEQDLPEQQESVEEQETAPGSGSACEEKGGNTKKESAAEQTEPVEEWPALGEASKRKTKKTGKTGKSTLTSPESDLTSGQSQAVASSGASSVSNASSGRASSSRVFGSPFVGSVKVEGRRLHWTLPSDGCFGSDARRLDDVPQGESLHSAMFNVAGVILQLAFFPSGTNLSGDGDSAVAVLCEDKTKLKFELFFNGKGRGTKVMLGQKFSCDFRKPDMSDGSNVQISLEVHSNLLYTGFY
eukprot:TRINITY_DN9028_c0_g1_i1.p1 TRINITY_DN9028_c0_g1~~TRINITY_DN9028_c0_g1_i1.p1  ORF type:complete len:395 (+),score=104.57 TRINITY_DN9028_c0_g1_i1:107-1291(+)